MKKVILWALLLVLVALLIFWVGGRIVESQAQARPWPRNLGPAREVAVRHPPAPDSPAATELVRLATAAGVNLQPGSREQKPPEKVRAALADYIRLVIEEPTDTVAPAPALAAQYLAEHEAHFDELRNHLIDNGAAIVWRSNLGGDPEPVPNLLGHLQLARVFTARALVKARNGDVDAWDELRVVWELSRPLWKRPEVLSILIALANSRMANAAARKMPDPKEPEWFREMRAFDATGAMIAAQQAEAWRIGEMRSELTADAPDSIRFLRPIFRFPSARLTNRIREYVEAVDRSGACDVRNVGIPKSEGPNLTSAFHRVLRYRAEVEGTARILQLRRGETPSPQSQCKDGTWTVEARGIRFSKDIPVEPPGHRIPLAYELPRQVVVLPPPSGANR